MAGTELLMEVSLNRKYLPDMQMVSAFNPKKTYAVNGYADPQ